MAKAEKHPFLFYGHSPTDWTEGSQLWLIRFVEPPTQQALQQLGETLAEVLLGAALEIRELVLSSSHWGALFSEDCEGEETFQTAARLFLALHSIAPIAEVIHACSRDHGSSAWDRWTCKQQPLPSPVSGVRLESGEMHRRVDIYFRTRGSESDYPLRCEAAEPIPMIPSRAFEEAFRARSAALWTATWDKALEQAKKTGKLALIPRPASACKPPALSADQAARIGPHVACALSASGRAVAIVPNAWPYHLAVLEPGADQAKHIEVERELPTKALNLSPGGDRVLYCASKQIREVLLETGKEDVLFQVADAGCQALSAAYLEDDRILAAWGGNDNVAVLKRMEGDSLREVSSKNVKGVGLVTLQGRYGFLSDDRALWVVGIKGEQIEVLGSLPVHLGNRVFEHKQDGVAKICVKDRGQLFEIFNLESNYDRHLNSAAAEPGKTSTKKPKPKKSLPETRNLGGLELEAVEPPVTRPIHPRQALWEKTYGYCNWFGDTATGRSLIAATPGLVSVEPEGALRELGLEPFSLADCSPHPELERALLVYRLNDSPRLCSIDLETARLEKLSEGDVYHAFYASAERVVALRLGRVELLAWSPEGLRPEPVATMTTMHLKMIPVCGNRSAVLTGGLGRAGKELDPVLLVVEGDTLKEIQLRAPEARLKARQVRLAFNREGALYVTNADGCFRVPLENG